MKRITSRIAALAIVSTAAGPLLADEPLPVRNCTWCHGTPAQGFMFAPRLAGQRVGYIENQLASFRNHTRDNPYSVQFMWPAVARLDSGTAHELALYFASLPPRAASDGDAELAAGGKAIYELGNPESNVAACVVCHGPNAEGINEIPRIGGLSFSYLKKRLEQWQEGYNAAAEPMPRIAATLSAQDIAALASYLSFIDYNGFER